jgi:HlyD family secretion protein
MKSRVLVIGVLCVGACGCGREDPNAASRASGYVEATEVRVAPEVGGRIVELPVDEGDRVEAGALVARLDTADVQLAIRRAEAERDQAVAQLRLLQAGSRPEEIRQAAAQVETARADVVAAKSELQSAEADLGRFEALLERNSGSRKQRDDAATRRDVARVSAVDAQIATLQKGVTDAALASPVAGVVTSRLVDRGELIAPRTAVVVITDLDRAWANVYVDEPVVPRLKLGQKVTLVTDAGQRLEGSITFISPKAEFTPRNVQTAEERSRLVYRIKVSADNRDGILKPGMPVEAEIPRQ